MTMKRKPLFSVSIITYRPLKADEDKQCTLWFSVEVLFNLILQGKTLQTRMQMRVKLDGFGRDIWPSLLHFIH